MRLANFESIFPDKETAAKAIRRMGMANMLSAEQVGFYLQAIAALELPEPQAHPINQAIMPNWRWVIKVNHDICMMEMSEAVGPSGGNFNNHVRMNVVRFAMPLNDEISDEEAEAAFAEAIARQAEAQRLANEMMATKPANELPA